MMNVKKLDFKPKTKNFKKPKSKFRKKLDKVWENISDWFEIFWKEIRYYCLRAPIRIVTNIWYFRKEIIQFRDFDHNYNFDLFIKSLEKTSNGIRKRKIIMESENISNEISRFCELYKRLRNDDYLEEIGWNWDLVEHHWDPIDDENSRLRIEYKKPYTKESWEEFSDKADIVRKKDQEEFFELFKKYERWWD